MKSLLWTVQVWHGGMAVLLVLMTGKMRSFCLLLGCFPFDGILLSLPIERVSLFASVSWFLMAATSFQADGRMLHNLCCHNTKQSVEVWCGMAARYLFPNFKQTRNGPLYYWFFGCRYVFKITATSL